MRYFKTNLSERLPHKQAVHRSTPARLEYKTHDALYTQKKWSPLLKPTRYKKVLAAGTICWLIKRATALKPWYRAKLRRSLYPPSPKGLWRDIRIAMHPRA